MRDRFTRESRHGRGKISKATRREVYRRDELTCQFCRQRFTPAELTIDHLVPLDRHGLNEITNFVTSCKACNQKKANLSIQEFAATLNAPIGDLPVHGDPIIDNDELPVQIRQLRRMIFDKYRTDKLRLAGKNAQKKLEKTYRRSFWETEDGKTLEGEFPSLPGHARVMVPEIKTLATSAREFWLLVELSKSARTRNLVGTVLTKGCGIEARFREAISKARDDALRKRMKQALARFEKRVNT